MDHFEPWEPETTVGTLWHHWAAGFDAPEVSPQAAVRLEDEVGRLAVLFRGLGGAASVEIRPATRTQSAHRLSFRRKLGTMAEEVDIASFDGEILRLPKAIATFPDPALNRAAFTWLTALAAMADRFPNASDYALQTDLARLTALQRAEARAARHCPGLLPLSRRLAGAYLPRRPVNRLPRAEATLEGAVRTLLGAPSPTPAVTALAEALRTGDPMLAGLTAPRRYKPLRPVPFWPVFLPPETATRDGAAEPEPPSGEDPAEQIEKSFKGKRQQSDQAESRDSLILHKFEAILSFAEFLNLNRRVDDDDPDAAKKAMDDLDELALTDVSKTPKTRFKLHLDLSAEDVNREAVAGQFTYPEWDIRQRRYLPDHCAVFENTVEPAPEPTAFDPAAQRRIRRVRRQFEAFRPRPLTITGQVDGDTLDLDAVMRARADLRATGDPRDTLWCRTEAQARDLAISILLDTSRSTESAVTGRPVLDIEREALTALAWGLEACGDALAIHGFSSLRRERVYVQEIKAFDTPMGGLIERRLAALRPGFYTRLGAAIRHVSARLQDRAQSRRLLIVLTDGKPNDLDHYEGRHGIEDTRMAIREARRQGQSVFGIAIDPKGQSWFPRLFGTGHYAVIADPDKLTAALPQIYRQLVGAGG
ncbi:VWA domain-containing protein [Ovoidimarina sediminis]|uniref:VWA domain-containing protein n=1 Tax=Ovoidimarina sediminis TaxID=3079856 RepID=UPI00290EAEB2|nr:VWA domain-containing protein [Rhodophyticola sp. MJ-SS7]MDU8941850.1 VWA domain-containing protein [Rhodophyticola sp. MJ-SS7]